jgi:putative ABC transport system ATP-binding protein
VLRDIDLTINQGEIVILCGPAGSGKTTLMRLIGGVLAVQQGWRTQLQVFGFELAGLSPGDLLRSDPELLKVRRRIGFLFQSPELIASLTAAENVAVALRYQSMSPRERRQRVEGMLSALGLEKMGRYRPTQLSYGQKKRVAIARGLVSWPRLILADDPVADLDWPHARDAVGLMQRLARDKGSTVLMVTQDDRLFHFADRILILEDGRIDNYERKQLTVRSAVPPETRSDPETTSWPRFAVIETSPVPPETRSNPETAPPVPLPRSPDPAFSSLTVICRYPVPIALPYRRFYRQPDPTTRLQMLFAALEATLRYLVFLGLADLLICSSDDTTPPALRGEAFEFLRSPRPMLLGKWAAALRELARALQEQPGRFLHELPLVCGAQNPLFGQAVGRLIDLRNNRLVHPEDGVPADAEKCREFLGPARSDLEQVLQHLQFLTAYPLGFSQRSPIAARQPGLHRYQLHSCTGAQPASTGAASILETPQPLPEDKVPFLVAPDGRRLLCLWPFLSQRVAVASERHTLYLFKEIADRKAAYLREIQSVAVDGCDRWPQVLCEAPARDLDWLCRRLREMPSVREDAPAERLQDRLGHHHEGRLVGQRLGRYRLLGVLGVGGFGTVYVAQEEESGQRVAVKVLESPQAGRLLARFEREIDKLRQAGAHPHVVQCLESGRDDYPWYAMEFAGGGDLAERIAERRPADGTLPWTDPAVRRDLVGEFRAVASAAAHLHRLGILHRDIKPANVLILEDGTLRLSDFGLVKSLDPSEQSLLEPASSIGAVLGTHGYMAPEQAFGLDVDARADVYALGVLLAELATGQRPRSVRAGGEGSPLNAWALLNELPPPLRRFILRCTDRNREERPADGRTVGDQFEQVLKQLGERGG